MLSVLCKGTFKSIYPPVLLGIKHCQPFLDPHLPSYIRSFLTSYYSFPLATFYHEDQPYQLHCWCAFPTSCVGSQYHIFRRNLIIWRCRPWQLGHCLCKSYSSRGSDDQRREGYSHHRRLRQWFRRMGCSGVQGWHGKCSRYAFIFLITAFLARPLQCKFTSSKC